MTESPRSIADLMSLAGQTVTVTGAGQGFGRAIASRLAEAGATVHVVDRDSERAADAAARLSGPGSVLAHTLDITDEPAVRAFFGDLASDGPVSLVNNAGVFSNAYVESLAIDEFQRIMAVNVAGTFLMSKEFVRSLPPDAPGRIVNIASVDGLHPSCPGLVHYTTSKHAVIGLTRSMAMELAPRGVRVNAVCPGAAITEGALALISDGTDDGVDVAAQWSGIVGRTPLGRLIDPDDVAKAVLTLLSGLADNITGIALPVDGGILVQPLEGYVDEGTSHE